MPGTTTAPAHEAVELSAWEDAYCAASPAVRAAGIRHTLTNGVLVTTAPDYDILALNRVIGLGERGPGEAEAVDTVLTAFRAAGSARCMAAVSPDSERLTTLLRQRGFYHHNNWVRLTRDATPPPGVETAFSIRRLGAEQRDAFGELIRKAFHWPAAAAGLFGSTVGRADWIHYGAFENGQLVAAGGMFLRNRTAWLGPAATDLRARGRGAQTALIVARLTTGIHHGVETFTVETAEPTSERPVGSFRNLTRLGFEVAYSRPNWVAKLR